MFIISNFWRSYFEFIRLLLLYMNCFLWVSIYHFCPTQFSSTSFNYLFPIHNYSFLLLEKKFTFLFFFFHNSLLEEFFMVLELFFLGNWKWQSRCPCVTKVLVEITLISHKWLIRGEVAVVSPQNKILLSGMGLKEVVTIHHALLMFIGTHILRFATSQNQHSTGSSSPKIAPSAARAIPLRVLSYKNFGWIPYKLACTYEAQFVYQPTKSQTKPQLTNLRLS